MDTRFEKTSAVYAENNLFETRSQASEDEKKLRSTKIMAKKVNTI